MGDIAKFQFLSVFGESMTVNDSVLRLCGRYFADLEDLAASFKKRNKKWPAVSIASLSWDDCSRHNMRLARLLRKYGLKSTFYLNIGKGKRAFLTERMARALSGDFEIGSHSVTHRDLTKLPSREIRFELVESKKKLEEWTGKPVVMFAYPFGRTNQEVVNGTRETGYFGARTTESFRIDIPNDTFRLWNTLQVTQPSLRKVFGNIVRYRSRHHLSTCTRFAHPLRFRRWASSYLTSVKKKGGIFHLWGHAWEVDDENLWDDLEKVLDSIATDSALYVVTNSELSYLVRRISPRCVYH